MKQATIALVMALGLFILATPNPVQRLAKTAASALTRDAAHQIFKKLPK